MRSPASPKILHVGFWQHVGFRQNNRVAFPPLQKLAKQAQDVILLDGPSDVCSLFGDNEGNRVHPKARHAELEPKAHDFQNLGLHLGMRRVEVGLEIIESIENTRPSLPGRSSRLFSARRETPY